MLKIYASDLFPSFIIRKRRCRTIPDKSKMAESADSENEWEETLMMLQLPSRASTNKIEDNSYCQILGISSGQPLVKIKNHLFAGQLSQTIGTHLFLEIDDKSGSTQAKKNEIKDITMSEKTMVLDPVYLEAKKDKTSKDGKE